MATIQVREDVYRALVRRAADQKTTVEQLVEPALTQLAGAATPAGASGARERALNDWMELVQRRAGRYPKRFVVDDSRERIYEGRGE